MIDMNLKPPKQNLFLITLLFWLTGGIYLPIWFINRDSFLCHIGEKKRSLKLLYFISLIVLIASIIIGAWSAVEQGRTLEQTALLLRMATGMIGVFFIVQLIQARSVINKYLLQQSGTQKTISSLLFGTLLVIAYIAIASMTNTESALLLANFPAILLLQNKINKLSIEHDLKEKLRETNMTKKIVFFIAYFLLVTVVAAAMKKPEATVPPISDAILIVGFFFAVGYGLFRLISNVFFKK